MTQPQDSFVDGATAEWVQARIPGISVKLLRKDAETGASASLVRFAPGARFPAHDHPAGEEVFVVEGEVRIGAHLLKTGDYLYAPPGCVHAASSETGCVFLVTLPRPVVIIKDQ